MDFDDIAAERGAAGPTVLEGRFAESAAMAGDEMTVRVPWMDSNRSGVPVEWAPYPGASGPVLPSAGDPVWIAEAMNAEGTGNRWIVVMWHPAS